MKIGSIRVSKHEQNEALQRDTLKEAGCEKYFSDGMTGSKFERKGLEQLLTFARSGDAVIVWKLTAKARRLTISSSCTKDDGEPFNVGIYMSGL
jgi:DNA invertase Pin-like site-specific DNA recombinase